MDRLSFEVVGVSLAVFNVGSEGTSGSDDFIHHPHRKCSGTDSRVADADGSQFVIYGPGMFAYALGKFVGVGFGLTSLADHTMVIFYRRLAVSHQLFNILFADVAVQFGRQVVGQTFLTHVMDDLARGVVGACGFAVLDCQEIFEDLAEHFRINRDLFFQRFVFFDGEVVAVKDVQNAVAGVALFCFAAIGEQVVGKKDVGVDPVVVIQWFKQATVEEGNAAVKAIGPIFRALGREGVVEQRL